MEGIDSAGGWILAVDGKVMLEDNSWNRRVAPPGECILKNTSVGGMRTMYGSHKD